MIEDTPHVWSLHSARVGCGVWPQMKIDVWKDPHPTKEPAGVKPVTSQFGSLQPNQKKYLLEIKDFIEYFI